MKVRYCVCLFYLQIIAFAYSKPLTDTEATFVLKKPGTYVRNATELLEKLNKIIEMGPNHLLIITDFDKTLTTVDPGDSSKKVLNSFSILKLCPSIPQSIKDEDERLFQTNWKIVNDPKLSIEEQSNHMTEWYTTRVNLLKGVKFPRNEVKAIAGNATLREGVPRLMSWSQMNNVPVIVLSAGLGDAVDAALETHGALLSNVKVISNFLALDHDDFITGWKRTIVHHHNKNKVIKNDEYAETVQGRNNVILMGDQLWDANMADTIEFEHRIKIGFVHSEINVQRYLDNYDIVLVDDHTMDVINSMVKLIG